MAGYVSTGALPHILAACHLAAPGRPGHEPDSYEAVMAVATTERWVTVTCTCGHAERMTWGGETETYRDALVQAWVGSSCSTTEISS
jgi:hypothetical protein